MEEDGNVDLQCQVEADTAYPITRVIWMKNGLLISSVRFYLSVYEIGKYFLKK